MNTILFVNSCPRGEASRTLRLARTFLDTLQKKLPDWQVIGQDLNTLGLKSIDAQALAFREKKCDERDFTDPFFKEAVAFQQADAVVIAAPYWDLSFPSELKVWVENMYVRNLAFYYEGAQCIGTCRGKEAVYITTAGSPIGDRDWGAGYIRAVLDSLGIKGFTRLCAEGLDLWENDPVQLMKEADAEAVRLAEAVAGRLNGGK